MKVHAALMIIVLSCVKSLIVG